MMTPEGLSALESLNELRLTDDERTQTLSIFQRMESYETALQAIQTDNVEVMVHVMPLTNILRDDVQEQPFTRESLLEGAPEHTEDSWQVPRLVK
ncbi:MAG: Asp-tRNA(Asn)/Glu-tRNA(Gln) amidotransferase subunit GatC [Oscillospiraceae bacterium]|nr:Asp-tRNA(Asn)/Glu-tRNA(Gln) amidotransferase subunit GatC [Oscillospiraceae bacterium]